MKCILCNKQYVGKPETSFNIRPNNHRKDVKKVDAIMACKHFQQESHNFNKHAKFTIIDKLTNTSKSKETLAQRLIERENFWILKLNMLYPKGCNMEPSSKDNNYNKRLLSYISLSNICFSPLQLGHHRAEKSPFWKTYLTSYLSCSYYRTNAHRYKDI